MTVYLCRYKCDAQLCPSTMPNSRAAADYPPPFSIRPGERLRQAKVQKSIFQRVHKARTRLSVASSPLVDVCKYSATLTLSNKHNSKWKKNNRRFSTICFPVSDFSQQQISLTCEPMWSVLKQIYVSIQSRNPGFLCGFRFVSSLLSHHHCLGSTTFCNLNFLTAIHPYIHHRFYNDK